MLTKRMLVYIKGRMKAHKGEDGRPIERYVMETIVNGGNRHVANALCRGKAGIYRRICPPRRTLGANELGLNADIQ